MSQLSHILLIFLGGGLGATARWSLDSWVRKHSSIGHFPLGIFVVNMLGCLLIGVLAGWLSRYKGAQNWCSPFLITGFLGAFTTFSTFTLHLVENHLQRQWGIAILYAGLSVMLGFCLALGGYVLTRN